MDFIDSTFASLSTLANNELPAGVLTNLVSRNHTRHWRNSDFHSTNCLLVSIYFPLEESGYMSRVVFLMDKIMRNFGLSGKSVVPLISGTACAIPALWQHEILKTGRSD
jgi:ferrous iron transport protein B